MASILSISWLDWISTVLFTCLFVHGVCTINFMSKKTPWPRKIGYTVFTVGSFGSAIVPVYGMENIYISNLLVAAGLALVHGYQAGRRWASNHQKQSCTQGS